jgi:hypothetical protein
MLPLSEYPDLLRRYETALAMIEQIQQPKHHWKEAISNWMTNAKEAICTVLNSEPVTQAYHWIKDNEDRLSEAVQELRSPERMFIIHNWTSIAVDQTFHQTKSFAIAIAQYSLVVAIEDSAKKGQENVLCAELLPYVGVLPQGLTNRVIAANQILQRINESKEISAWLGSLEYKAQEGIWSEAIYHKLLALNVKTYPYYMRRLRAAKVLAPAMAEYIKGISTKP